MDKKKPSAGITLRRAGRIHQTESVYETDTPRPCRLPGACAIFFRWCADLCCNRHRVQYVSHMSEPQTTDESDTDADEVSMIAIQIRIPPTWKAWLESQAKAQGQTLSAHIRQIIYPALKKP